MKTSSLPPSPYTIFFSRESEKTIALDKDGSFVEQLDTKH